MHDALKSPPTFSGANDQHLSQEWTEGKGRFLIDGFPRKMDQALKFDETVSRLHLAARPVIDTI
jgi:UMP-CMP kinase